MCHPEQNLFVCRNHQYGNSYQRFSNIHIRSLSLLLLALTLRGKGTSKPRALWVYRAGVSPVWRAPFLSSAMLLSLHRVKPGLSHTLREDRQTAYSFISATIFSSHQRVMYYSSLWNCHLIIFFLKRKIRIFIRNRSLLLSYLRYWDGLHLSQAGLESLSLFSWQWPLTFDSLAS